MTTDLPTISHSQLRSYRHCQQQWDYRYRQLLIPKREGRPLRFGNWVHTALQSHYRGENWRTGHEEYLAEYNALFDEERLELDRGSSRSKGPWEPLPNQVERVVRSYLWYYRNDGWKAIAVEVPFAMEVTLPDGRHVIIKGRIDLVVQDRNGRYWVVDHKTTTDIPPETAFHSMDPQLIIYPLAVEREMGLVVEGVIYNYIESKAPSLPKLNKDGTISKQEVKTDYPTLYRFLKANDRDVMEYSEVLLSLQEQSPFLRRYRLPRTATVTERILAEAKYTTSEILDHTFVTRNVTRQCQQCAYENICRGDLFGLDTSFMREQFFVVEGVNGNSGAAEYSPSESAEAAGGNL
jgi:RecB family exonuclease